MNQNWRTLVQLYCASETLFRAGRKIKKSPKSPAQAETEDSSKIKDRLEALLCAETLQETLFPNANPGKGSVGGLLNLMPKATARIQRAAQTLVHLSSVDLLYQSEWDCARGESKKVTRGRVAHVSGVMITPFSLSVE